tara:strand:+ start:791 stop:1408 length:618 start_codon:yes stop_codon:yes gene_type:complete
MEITNECTNQNINVFFKKGCNSNIKNNNDQYLTDGISIIYNCNININSNLIVKSHLPNIGYYDITINNNIIDNIAISESFTTKYDNNVLSGLVITNDMSIRDEVIVKENIIAFSTFTSSDIKLKKNIKNIENGLDVINKLHPVEFTWKKNNKKSVGFIAQELEEVLPNLVKTDKNNIKAIKQDKLIPYIVDSIKNISNRLRKYES